MALQIQMACCIQDDQDQDLTQQSCGRRNYIGIYLVKSIPDKDKNIL